MQSPIFSLVSGVLFDQFRKLPRHPIVGTWKLAIAAKHPQKRTLTKDENHCRSFLFLQNHQANEIVGLSLHVSNHVLDFMAFATSMLLGMSEMTVF
jgi:hypothetical protein